MPLFLPDERRTVESVARLAACNPFVPEFVERERALLGPDHAADRAVWNLRAQPAVENQAVAMVGVIAERVARGARERLRERPAATRDELVLYAQLVVYTLFQRYAEPLHQVDLELPRGRGRVACYRQFRRDLEHFLAVPGLRLPGRVDPAHLFACFHQIRRAFHLIYRHIIGASRPAAHLRASVWQSIFTHDLWRYWRSLHDRMHDITTLITGPSGTGKELVARAIALSRYVPFDPERESFAGTLDGAFHTLNVSALSPTLIESELFGHRKGAFTGAVQDRVGWLESCPAMGTVLLDEVGEIDASIQVKLLRVLQSREFQRIGETTPREFKGKLIAATNRDLAAEMRAGRFREDLYYRLCSDLVETPSLRDQLRDAPDELRNLVLFVCERVIGETGAPELAAEVMDCIERDLGPDYLWPGNVRELEQCVRNVLVRKRYRPPSAPPTDDGLTAALQDGGLTARELLGRYCTTVYARTGSYQETARRLALDRRTVKQHIDRELLDRLRGGTPTASS
ncbi:MAG: sigma 54-interacting transcriptional regulator [Acidobacteria bacterium]|nr:sigma 54-interacting transcriptional regulator [Acidobacteriota bacterium]